MSTAPDRAPLKDHDVARAHRFSRQVVLPEIGREGQARLDAAKVLVVGCGGLGSPAIQYLASAGVGSLTLVDDDVIDLSNLNRQVLHRTCDLGRSKAERAAEWIAALDASLQVEAEPVRLSIDNARELVADHQLVVDCTDGLPNKYLLNDACVLEQVPLVHGAVTAFAGQIIVRQGAAGGCLRCIFPTLAPPELVPSCQDSGVLGAACGVVGSLMALEALKVLAQVPSDMVGRLVTLDLLYGSLDAREFVRDPACTVCGERPSIDGRNADDYVWQCKVP